MDGMYGKHFEAMYDGSMYGAGFAVFSVMGYVIAHTKQSRVELNPKKLADTFGEDEFAVAKALDFLASPDPKSRLKAHEGRRLVAEEGFQYFVPGWEKYQKIRNEIDRRESNRVAQAAHREKVKAAKTGWKKGVGKITALPGATAYEKAEKNGAPQKQLDDITTRHLPESLQ